ncbi:hypothetical protein [Halorubrum cibi]|uniref:Uncharacterized protein n=1 Tax=Halorubrum cibi TaxID=413815 RepID=A0A521EZE0_9EURY|nr:hypothetical protein [Halorubrum cibi]SMO88540.1 hypothetical protein SAMN06264867_11353 [Halorubrum cibi]
MGGSDVDESDSADGSDRDPGPVAPEEIGPAGAMIAAAFTGSVIAFAGFGLFLLFGDVGLILAGIGLLVVLASPAAYLRYRQLYR